MSSKVSKSKLKKILGIVVLIALFIFAWKTGILQEILIGGGGQESQDISMIEEESLQESKQESRQESRQESKEESGLTVVKGQPYYTKEEVALYIHLFGKLPPNYITKSKAEGAGWVASKGNLWKVTDKMVIGGDTFGNREGLLPKKSGRKWYECDVNYYGGYRGEERLLYSSDGLIFYTDDHYETFTQLY